MKDDERIVRTLMAMPIGRRQAELLRIMRDRDEWLAQDGLAVWVDDERTSASMAVRMLLQLQIKPASGFYQSMVGPTYYEITQTGLEALKRYDEALAAAQENVREQGED